jgi:hypothetical protein
MIIKIKEKVPVQEQYLLLIADPPQVLVKIPTGK